MRFLLNKNDLTLDIEIHSDPLCILPAALSRSRAFKRNKVVQEEMPDNEDGPAGCPFCNTNSLDTKPAIRRHLNGKVISFPNAAPFLPGDQRVICLSHDDRKKRYAYAHRYTFSDFGAEDFYAMTYAAVELAKEFPTTPDGEALQKGSKLIRCIAGFNIGRLAGQSIPHLHLQYGWEVALAARDIKPEVLNLYYRELRDEKLVLYEDESYAAVVPWTPKGQYHIEIHFKGKYELSHMEEEDVRVLSYIANHIVRRYEEAGIRNVNILFSGSPYRRAREPLTAQFVPRVNMTALYEMLGVNVVDTFPEDISSFFQLNVRWRDIAAAARKFDPQANLKKRYQECHKQPAGR